MNSVDFERIRLRFFSVKTHRVANAPVDRSSTTNERAADDNVLPEESNSEKDEVETFDSCRNFLRRRENFRQSYARRSTTTANLSSVDNRNRREATVRSNSVRLIDSFEKRRK